MRTFQEVFDYYQAVIYQRDTLTDAVAKLLRATRSARMLALRVRNRLARPRPASPGFQRGLQ